MSKSKVKTMLIHFSDFKALIKVTIENNLKVTTLVRDSDNIFIFFIIVLYLVFIR
jgi:hypothetical protein